MPSFIRPASSWPPRGRYLEIETIDAHTGGEPFRVVVDGFPELHGSSMLELRSDAKQRFDHLRKALMWEPRGHPDMYGCLLTPPVSEGADFGILFMHNEGFSTMCGHGIIAIATVCVETHMIPASGSRTELRIDTPAGLVEAVATGSSSKVESVSFRNVPSFVVDLDARVDVPGLGTISYDLAFGGAFYAVVDARTCQAQIRPRNSRKLIDLGIAIKSAIVESRSIRHPLEPELGFLYGVIFVETLDEHVQSSAGRGETVGLSRNACVFADGELDRSPTGTGVSARVAIHHARGELDIGETLAVESIIGSRFDGRFLQLTTVGDTQAIIPEITGSAAITGKHRFLIDPRDSAGDSFLLR